MHRWREQESLVAEAHHLAWGLEEGPTEVHGRARRGFARAVKLYYQEQDLQSSNSEFIQAPGTSKAQLLMSTST